MDIQKTISKMTLEEKASLCSGLDFWHTKPVERLGVASCMVSDGPHGLRKQDDKADHLGVNESIKAVCFPAGCATAASFDRDLMKQLGEAIGDSCQHEKLSVVLGPAVNIKRSPLCGRNFEYYSEDPYLAGETAASFINGVQSRNVGVSVKHFAANNQEHRRMSSNSTMDERTLREIYLTPFEIAVKKAHPWTIMCSYNRINGVFSSDNRMLLTDILRKEWGFDGYVMTDWGAMNNRVEGIKAGLDLEMPASGGVTDKQIVAAVRAGQLDEKLVDQAVARILTINQRYLDNAQPDTIWDKEAQHALARRMAGECMVLLKNEGNLLPLARDASIAVIGRFARQPRFQGGGSSHINSFKVTSAWDELKDYPHVVYAEGYDLLSDAADEGLLAQAERAAKSASVAVIFAGLPDSFESEGYDRVHMSLPACQVALIQRVAAVNPNTVVVLHNGSPIEMPWIGSVKAVLEAYLGGQAGGGAVVDVLFGDQNPCGRLPETFPLKLEDNPSYLTYGGEGDSAVYAEGVFVGYRYYDKKKMNVLFSFGYGLSYTRFEYANLVVSADEIKDTDVLTVSVDVTNTGILAGKEVVQLYVADRESSVFRPLRELKGYEKVYLEPGATTTVVFRLSKRAFAYWNAQLHDWHVETGVFGIQIGRSSRDIVLEKDVTVTSTQAPRRAYTRNSIFYDIMADPKAMAVMKPLLDSASQLLGGDNTSEAAASAITEEMTKAMIGYMPLRGLLSFTNGQLTSEQLDAMIAEMNR